MTRLRSLIKEVLSQESPYYIIQSLKTGSPKYIASVEGEKPSWVSDNRIKQAHKFSTLEDAKNYLSKFDTKRTAFWHIYKRPSGDAGLGPDLKESKKDCNCGCGGCDKKSPIITEGRIKKAISEGLTYHVENKIPLHESVYRIGSEKHFALINEARKLWTRGLIDVSEDDQAILETHLGNFGMYEGEEVPLDMPMVNEEKDRAKEIMNDLFGYGFEFDYTYKPEGDKIVIDAEGYNDDGTLFDMKDVHKEKIIRTFLDKMPNADAKPNMGGGITVHLSEGTFQGNEIAIYGGEDGETYIEKRGTGYYGYNNSFDFTAKDKAELKQMLSMWGYYPIAGSIDADLNEGFKDYLGYSDHSEKDKAKYRVEYTTQDGEKAKSQMYNSEEEANKKEKQLVDSGVKKAKVVKVEESVNEVHKLLRQTNLSSEEYQKAKKLKGFNADDYTFSSDNNLYVKKSSLEERINTILEAKKKKKKEKKDPPLNKPKRGGSKAYYVYVRDPKTKKIKKVSFGSGGLRAKIKNKEARNAFAARHNCKNKKDRTKAGYWSCNLPRYADQLGLGSKMNTFW